MGSISVESETLFSLSLRFVDPTFYVDLYKAGYFFLARAYHHEGHTERLLVAEIDYAKQIAYIRSDNML